MFSKLSYESPQSINASLRSSSNAYGENLYSLKALASYFESKTLALYISYAGDH